LSNDGNDTGHPNTSIVPLLDNTTLPDVEHDEGKGVNQRKDEHGPGNPVVPHVQLLVRNASQGSDWVRLGSENNQEWHAGKCHEASAGGDGRRAAIVGIRPIIRLRSEGHGEEEDHAYTSEEVSTQ
jgi:hypothetical protein